MATSTSPAPTPSAQPRGLDRTGLALGLGTYLLWGSFPIYFKLFTRTDAVELVAQRVVWGLVVCLLLLVVARRWRAFVDVWRRPRQVAILATAALLVGGNWLIYVWGVQNGHVVDASLGYYVNPLLTVLLAVVLLRERLTVPQWWAIGVGAAAVLVVSFGGHGVPWLALSLALTFGLYGLLKKQLGTSVDALAGLGVETAVLAPLGLGYLLWLGPDGSTTGGGAGYVVLLATLGVATVVPLVMFSAAAQRLPLSIVGLLQYVTPTLQLGLGVLLYDEPMSPARWAGFALVWVALTILTVDAVRSLRRPRDRGPRG
ncbi:EamA family transporter RarD [Sanguibacter sp. HDW7]|uniref:EamA family transporter RarD n=1 Tax=Sanguibacter sp. HDW7 TaxID=2714931 RepID=UPI001407F6DC|nr:EamA family transporter RarD [Sanguibacter sp. HDW7]QIK84833.1 EamA family transporter RarD [Sanguibacter sp. HDW7]